MEIENLDKIQAELERAVVWVREQLGEDSERVSDVDVSLYREGVWVRWYAADNYVAGYGATLTDALAQTIEQHNRKAEAAQKEAAIQPIHRNG